MKTSILRREKERTLRFFLLKCDKNISFSIVWPKLITRQPYQTSDGEHGSDRGRATGEGRRRRKKGKEAVVVAKYACTRKPFEGFRVRALYKHRATVSAAVSEQREAEWLSEGAGPRGPHWLLNYIWMERKGCCLATAYTALRQNGEARSIRTPVISLMRVALPRSSLNPSYTLLSLSLSLSLSSSLSSSFFPFYPFALSLSLFLSAFDLASSFSSSSFFFSFSLIHSRSQRFRLR